MLEYHVPALPVVDEQSFVLVGIVSRSDILRCVVNDPPLTLWA
jgi:CBS-domain-containing membrane protein